jgi:cellulose synthase/poly-beta-1,6-N-acetylglucosamine synthase-like glycosyltransferase
LFVNAFLAYSLTDEAHMIVLAVIGLAAIVFFLGMPVYWSWRFAARYSPQPDARLPDDQLPRAAVLLSIRGADPSLRLCLEGLLAQDYPDYDIRIVVDNAADPAWEIVRAVVADHPVRSVTISLLETRFGTCALKLSALIQSIRALDESYGVVATIDADVVPHRSWLRDLATPFADPRVGAATGVRWYMPVRRNLGTMVRYLWNAGAVTQMAAFRIPWGGSMAYRAELFRTTDLLRRWQHSFCEDAGTTALLQ